MMLREREGERGFDNETLAKIMWFIGLWRIDCTMVMHRAQSFLMMLKAMSNDI